MKLYGFPISPNVRKAMAVLEHKNLKYEIVQTYPGTKTPEYLEISPLGYIPGFEDGDLKVSDSTIIAEYLEDRYPANSLLPSSPADRARSRWYSEYGGAVLFPLTFQLVNWETKEEYRSGTPEEARVEDAKNILLPNALDYLEAELPKKGMLCGKFSIGDVGVAAPLISVQYAGFNIDPSRWPKFAAYMKEVKAQPAFVKCAEAERGLVEIVMRDPVFS